mmetsp:Transcript_14552/g.46621  ORF Transcript_14552/g.46621 Transcript_14552/m.46621 type:complete len:251 (-) Transcript_14552:1066-1818(-)
MHHRRRGGGLRARVVTPGAAEACGQVCVFACVHACMPKQAAGDGSQEGDPRTESARWRPQRRCPTRRAGGSGGRCGEQRTGGRQSGAGAPRAVEQPCRGLRGRRCAGSSEADLRSFATDACFCGGDGPGCGTPGPCPGALAAALSRRASSASTPAEGWPDCDFLLTAMPWRIARAASSLALRPPGLGLRASTSCQVLLLCRSKPAWPARTPATSLEASSSNLHCRALSSVRISVMAFQGAASAAICLAGL